MSKIKICGIFRLQDADYINEALPDYVGFVFYPKSSRYVSIEKAIQLRSLISQEVTAVGVFVNSPLELPINLVKAGCIQVIQLHGTEDDDYVQNLLRKIPDAEIWQAYLVKKKEDFIRAQQSKAHRILLDSGQGSGVLIPETFLPPLLDNRHILAGGLTPENIRAKLAFQPWALDLSSGVEANGVKNKEKILRAVRAVKELGDGACHLNNGVLEKGVIK